MNKRVVGGGRVGVGGGGGGDWKFVLVLRQGMVPSWTRYIMSFDAEHEIV